MISLDRDKFVQTINSKWKNKNCPMCGENNWNIDKGMVSPMKISEKGGIELGGQIMPLAAVTCMNCGNVLFVNPIVIGALENRKEEN